MKQENICRECGQVIEGPSNNFGGTGYAIYNDGSLVCYACQGKLDLEMLEGLTVNQFFPNAMYYDEKKKVITNWPGSLVIPCFISYGDHNWKHAFNTMQVYVQFTHKGKNYYGRAVSGPNSGNIIQIRRIKDTHV